jgi:hypothetical protein
VRHDTATAAVGMDVRNQSCMRTGLRHGRHWQRRRGVGSSYERQWLAGCRSRHRRGDFEQRHERQHQRHDEQRNGWCDIRHVRDRKRNGWQLQREPLQGDLSSVRLSRRPKM